jgi:hypothetical protein
MIPGGFFQDLVQLEPLPELLIFEQELVKGTFTDYAFLVIMDQIFEIRKLTHGIFSP